MRPPTITASPRAPTEIQPTNVAEHQDMADGRDEKEYRAKQHVPESASKGSPRPPEHHPVTRVVGADHVLFGVVILSHNRRLLRVGSPTIEGAQGFFGQPIVASMATTVFSFDMLWTSAYGRHESSRAWRRRRDRDCAATAPRSVKLMVAPLP